MEQLAVRSVKKHALSQMHEDEGDKGQRKWIERLARLSTLKAPTHRPGPVAESCKSTGESNTAPSSPLPIYSKNDKPLKASQAKTDAASTSEGVSSITRPSSPPSSASHSKSSSTTDESHTSGTTYLTTIGSISTSIPEETEVRELERGVFVAPRLSIPCDDIERWNSVKPRLEDALLNLFKPKPGMDPSLSLELVMAGPVKASLKPSIVLTCCNEPHRKHLKKLLKSQKWLAATGYPLIVVVDPLQQLSLILKQNESSPSNHNYATTSGISLGLGLGLGVLSLALVIALFFWRRRVLLKRKMMVSRQKVAQYTKYNMFQSDIHGPNTYTTKDSVITISDATELEMDYPPQARMPRQERTAPWSGVAVPATVIPRAENFKDNSSKPSISAHKPSLFVYVQIDTPERKSLCGAPAIVADSASQNAYFTIGGTILINGSVYGLTAGHPIENLNREPCASKGAPGSILTLDPEPDPDLDSDSDFDTESTSPWIFLNQENSDDTIVLDDLCPEHQVRGEDTGTPSPSSVSSLELQVYQTPGRLISTITTKAHAMKSCDNEHRKARMDWALLEMNDTLRWPVNALVYGSSSSAEEILHVAETADLQDGEVTVAAGFTGVTRGWLKRSPVTLRLESRTYEVKQIVLESPLVRGDSGAWVTRNGMFCGHILAQKTLTPIAYMLPAQGILEDIKTYMGTDDVKLPSNSW